MHITGYLINYKIIFLNRESAIPTWVNYESGNIYKNDLNDIYIFLADKSKTDLDEFVDSHPENWIKVEQPVFAEHEIIPQQINVSVPACSWILEVYQFCLYYYPFFIFDDG